MVGPEFKLLQKLNLSKHGSTNTSCSPNLQWSNRFFFQNDETPFWHWKLTLKIKMWWFLTQLTQVTASSIEFTIAGSIFWVKVYIWLAVCSKSEVMLKDSTMLSVNVPWALLTPFLRIGARHRAFFSSLDLWRLVQETILYFQQLQWAVSFRLQNQWTLKFVTIATLCYIYTWKSQAENRLSF